MKILVTGSAGFIGANLIHKLNELTDWEVYGIDNIFSSTEEQRILQSTRINELTKPSFHWTLDMRNEKGLHSYLDFQKFDMIVHLAAIPGVRDSINNAGKYIDNNITSTLNLFEWAKKNKTPIIYASSSTVYGNSRNTTEQARTDKQLSPYAVSKKTCELIAENYFQLYRIPSVGLRFFTVYGPYGRPDMVYYKWVKQIFNDEEIIVNGTEQIKRSFTYIDSATDAIIHIIRKGIEPAHTIYNIGDKNYYPLYKLREIIEKILGRSAKTKCEDYALGDAKEIIADSTLFEERFNYDLSYPLEAGIEYFISWFIDYQQKIKG